MTTHASPSIQNLIAQSGLLIQKLRKSHRGDMSELRSAASKLIKDLDAGHPKQSAIQQTLGLIRELASEHSDFDILRKRSLSLDEQLDVNKSVSHKHVIPDSTRKVDAWILDMFRATESAIPREQLVDDFVS